MTSSEQIPLQPNGLGPNEPRKAPHEYPLGGKIVSVVLGFLMLACAGAVYSVGAWSEELLKVTGWSQHDLDTMLQLMNLGVYLPIHLGLYIDYFGQNASFMLALVALSTAWYTLWWQSASGGPPWMGKVAFALVGQGVFVTFAQGVATNIDLFPNQRGLVQGLMLGGVGCGGIFLPIFYREVYGGRDVVSFLFALASTCTVALVLGLLFSVPSSKIPKWKRNSVDVLTVVDPNGYTSLQMLNSGIFWIIYLNLVICGGIAIVTTQKFRSICGLDVHEASTRISTIAVLNLLMRWASGWLSDVFEKKLAISRAAIFIISSVFCVLTCAMLADMEFTNVIPKEQKVTLITLTCGATLGFLFGVFPTILRELYGIEHYGMNISLLMTANALGSYGCIYLFKLYTAHEMSYTSIYYEIARAALLVGLLSLVMVYCLPIGESKRTVNMLWIFGAPKGMKGHV